MSASSIFTTSITPEELNASQIVEGQMPRHLGIEMIAVDSDSMTARMPVDHRTIQRIGILHGGASLALAETVGSIAASYCIDRETSYIVGQEINANHIRPVRSGYVYAKATPHHLGRSSHVWEIKITSDEGKLVCISRFTVAVLRKPESGKR
ncbi:hotdog fold thioesterase [Prosthecochloris sp. N3]|uniref:Hotdog fold thioesterase n=1 Tax=Prosthecochloris ethylica TaxID=2743976 RepID=A0ABR9XQY3_9CHLB|nr:MULTISPECIES: hotdog fold thioesterase [Prosthecochloris]MBF0585462.1 hotdog fold thioesterase [Prosthecochloris ethylica]MBF0636248.1 hotdog fold thioesterase [Prosthecochloris ethylica]NUK46692.1 hotdog fold thioesterase [Prosthecochloris ethylica]RNA64712.1 hotdog fold thioesterase [Prosthecochloris sp. ZM_2]